MTKSKLFDLSIEERKKKKLNKLMSKAVVTRSPTQCHTHHQKMKFRYETIEGIINAYQYLLIKRNKKVKKLETIETVYIPSFSQSAPE